MGFLRTSKPDRNNRYTAKCEFCEKIIPDARVEKLARHFIDTGNPLQLCTVASQAFIDAYTNRYEENRKEALNTSVPGGNSSNSNMVSAEMKDKLMITIRR